MSKMQAVSLTAVTEISAVRTRQIAKPEPSENQVLLKMIAAGTNPMDWESASGPHAWIDAFPHTLGNEGTGTVVATGSQVRGIQIGDTVLAYSFGGSPGMLAEYNTVDADKIAILPAGLDPTAWAASPIGILSVFHALYKRGLPTSGTSILIEGTGGVGMFAIQWAKKLGLRVSVLATARSRDWAIRLGADAVFTSDMSAVELENAMGETSPAGFDIIFSTIGGTAIARLAGYLSKNGRFISTMPIQSPSGQEIADNSKLNAVSMNAVFKQNSWEWFLAEPSGKDMALMLSEALRLKIDCPIASRYPLVETSAALVQASKGGNPGKVLVTIP